MKLSRGFYFIFFGGLFTSIFDFYLSSSYWTLTFFAVTRFFSVLTALLYRIIYDYYDQTSHPDTTQTFWNPMKNIFVVIAAIQQSIVLYYFTTCNSLWSILSVIAHVSMPLLAYLWIRRIQREDLNALQKIWLEIVGHDPNNASSKQHDEYRILRRLIAYSRDDWKLVTCGTILLLGAALSEVFVPLYTGRLLSSVAFKDAWLGFRHNLIMFVVSSFAGGFFGGFRQGVFSVCISRLSIRLRTQLFKAYLRQEIGFFDTNESGKLLSRLNHDTQIMSSTVANNVAHCIGALVRFIGTVAMMIKLSIHLTIACLIGAPLILLVAKVVGNAHRRISEKVQNLSADALEIAEETIQTIRTVRSFGNEDEEIKRFETTLQQSYQMSVIQALLTAAQRWFVDLAQLFMSITMLSYGAKLVRDEYLSGPDLLAFIIYQLTLGGILSDISQIYSALMTAAGASHSVFDYLDRQPVQKPTGYHQPEEFRGNIQFEQVSLSYPARPDEMAVQNMTLNIKAGQICAFVGPSGSGKSTCVGLLERFYDPTQGKIMIDGHEIHEYDHKYLHQKIALVGQEPVLFNRTIRDNILYAVHHTAEQSSTEMVAAAKEANAHEFILSLSRGYETVCGQRGGHLSGGQKQRVAIARALLRQPKILLLDEATSALDAVNERLIRDALFNKREGDAERTVLICAHRLSTVERCDQIFVMHKGHLVEHGTHEELMNKENGLYRELVRRQTMDIDDD